MWKLTWDRIFSKIWFISCRVWSKLTVAVLHMLYLRHTHVTPRHTNAVLASHPCDASSYSCDAASYSCDAFKDQICNIFSDAPSDKSVFWDNQSGSTLKKQYSRLFPNSSFKEVVPWDDKVRFNYESKSARNCSIFFLKTKVTSEFFVLFRLFSLTCQHCRQPRYSEFFAQSLRALGTPAVCSL